MTAEIIDEFEFPETQEGFNEMLRELSPCGRIVMLAGNRPNGTYTYVLYFWDTSELEFMDARWAPCAEGGIFSDFSTAKHEAKKALISRSKHGQI